MPAITLPASKFIRVEVDDFKSDLGLPNPDIQGWQILLHSVGGGFEFRYVSISISTGELSTRPNPTGAYSLIESADVLDEGTPITLPNGVTITPIEYQREGKGNPPVNPPFPNSIFNSSDDVDFYYLAKSDLDFMLDNNPTHVYISSCELNFGGGIRMKDGGSYSMLKIECVDSDSLLQLQVSGNAPVPLFVIAPPCPPKWNNTFNGGGGLISASVVKTQQAVPRNPQD